MMPLDANLAPVHDIHHSDLRQSEPLPERVSVMGSGPTNLPEGRSPKSHVVASDGSDHSQSCGPPLTVL